MSKEITNNQLAERFDKLSHELSSFANVTKQEFEKVHKKIDRNWNEIMMNGDAIVQLKNYVELELAAHNKKYS